MILLRGGDWQAGYPCWTAGVAMPEQHGYRRPISAYANEISDKITTVCPVVCFSSARRGGPMAPLSPQNFRAHHSRFERPARTISKAMPRFLLATALRGAATVDRSKIPPCDQRSRAMRNVLFSNRIGHAVDPHLSPDSNVPNPGSRRTPAGPRQAG